MAAVAGAALLVGCTAGAVESPEPEVEKTMVSASPSMSPSVSVSPSAGPSPSPTTFESYPGELPTEDAESAAIIAGWQEYQRVLAKYLADPEGYTDFSETQYVTTGDQSNHILRNVEIYRENEIRNLGGLVFESLSVGEIQDFPSVRRGELTYCVDRSAVEIRKYDGDPYPTAGLSPRYVETATMEEGQDGVWRVALIENDQEEAC
ncbi:hypothetical protein H5392_10375 [Tessaracoccus sp. MC1865]|uniref:hypothetical protein n=1 Tax=Tessaracoccus sp. MC1865 TaxID=2760310 RepID=UPI0016028778|nr:hypothetical protein [Tessaracoccus sp. MC1865]MBB1484263.1 hypothetical protein [Tessaracoccus sp. MC1865]QTO37279.1 hypothetical protein J7D54_12740 [Tessaracoccus sp. MC1865]